MRKNALRSWLGADAKRFASELPSKEQEEEEQREREREREK